VRQQFPRAATANGVTDRIHDLAPGMFGRAATGFCDWHKRLEVVPLGIGEVGVVRLAESHLDSVRPLQSLNAVERRLFKRALSRLFLQQRRPYSSSSRPLLTHLLGSRHCH
jgi:hypothetical protein